MSKANNNYNELVDYQVQSMSRFESLSDTMTEQSEAPFDTQAYKNYKELVDKEREQIDSVNLIVSIYIFGFKIDQQLLRIIDNLDDILEEENESI